MTFVVRGFENALGRGGEGFGVPRGEHSAPNFGGEFGVLGEKLLGVLVRGAPPHTAEDVITRAALSVALIRPYRQCIAFRIGEMESAAAWKIEDVAGDGASGVEDALLRVGEIFGVEDDERRVGAFGGVGLEAALHGAIVEGGVGRAVVLEGPAEGVGVEAAGGVDVLGGELDVVDAEGHGETGEVKRLVFDE